jgi:hypothetical protein
MGMTQYKETFPISMAEWRIARALAECTRTDNTTATRKPSLKDYNGYIHTVVERYGKLLLLHLDDPANYLRPDIFVVAAEYLELKQGIGELLLGLAKAVELTINEEDTAIVGSAASFVPEELRYSNIAGIEHKENEHIFDIIRGLIK